jgi:hypothetical protein
MSLLDVTNPGVGYEPRDAEPATAVKGASFTVEEGELVGLVTRPIVDLTGRAGADVRGRVLEPLNSIPQPARRFAATGSAGDAA